MLTKKILELTTKSMSVSEARIRIEKLLADASSEEFLEMMFSAEAEPARQYIGSILDEYDRRRQQVLREMANSVPEGHRDFFVHAFSRRTPEDDPFQ